MQKTTMKQFCRLFKLTILDSKKQAHHECQLEVYIGQMGTVLYCHKIPIDKGNRYSGLYFSALKTFFFVFKSGTITDHL